MPDKNSLLALGNFYIPRQKLTGWLDFQTKATQLTGRASPLFAGHQILLMGACVAKHEDKAWTNPEQAVLTAFHYGNIFNAAAAYVCHATYIASFRNPKWWDVNFQNIEGKRIHLENVARSKRMFGLPVPNSASVLSAMHELWPTLDLGFAEGVTQALHPHTLYPRPSRNAPPTPG